MPIRIQVKNFLLVAYKPKFISSNAFLTLLKKHIGEKKAGYSGTLDPFASGLLIIGFGAYTKLLPFLTKSPKCYRATLFLGAQSTTLDIEGIQKVELIKPLCLDNILQVLDSLQGEISYIPPQFSAKHINGTRAYKLARSGISFQLERQNMRVFGLKLLAYNHPFLSFEVCLDEGGYVRSIGELISSKLGVSGALSALERISEGVFSLDSDTLRLTSKKEGELSHQIFEFKAHRFSYTHTQARFFIIPPDYALPFAKMPPLCTQDMALHGKKPTLLNAKSGIYQWFFRDFFSIIEIKENGGFAYICNRIPYADTLQKTR